ncbi:MAG: polyphosphate polymerase domain-containing protein [Oscillospiraceae bacterium]|nr:polyphosphate polymerase domain-containing protein [Oscillospiraceae bacterium]MDD4368910.1 polyphosphate polymerase domain-containing protein [Oscillospiraceae bacterium]
MAKSPDIFERHELKYLLSREQSDCLRQRLQPWLLADEFGRSTICNVYYDTPDFRLARRSQEKPVYKEKLRLRSYGPAQADSLVYLELKKKYRDVVYKRRIQMPLTTAEQGMRGAGALPDSQIGREISYFKAFYASLRPAVYLSYEREAFFARTDPGLRLTFDQNILWRTQRVQLSLPPAGQPLLEPGQALLEVKTAAALPLWLVRLLTELEINKTSFSKYGRAYDILRAAQLATDRRVNCA